MSLSTSAETRCFRSFIVLSHVWIIEGGENRRPAHATILDMGQNAAYFLLLIKTGLPISVHVVPPYDQTLKAKECFDRLARGLLNGGLGKLVFPFQEIAHCRPIKLYRKNLHRRVGRDR